MCVLGSGYRVKRGSSLDWLKGGRRWGGIVLDTGLGMGACLNDGSVSNENDLDGACDLGI